MSFSIPTDLWVLTLSQLQLLWLVFVLGSLTVAAWSDLKHMSVQKEFLEVWIVLILVGLVITFESPGPLGVWGFLGTLGVVALFLALSNNVVGILFSIAPADLAASAAVLVLLPILWAVVFVVALKVVDLVFRPVLRLVGDRAGYPFLPVLFLTTTGTLLLAWYLGHGNSF